MIFHMSSNSVSQFFFQRCGVTAHIHTYTLTNFTDVQINISNGYEMSAI